MGFGGMSIPKEIYDTVVQFLPKNKTILELGSGFGTDELLKKWNVISIEDNPVWLNIKHKSKFGYFHDFIYSPVIEIKLDGKKYKWYAPYKIKDGLENFGNKYDLIIIDGPNGKVADRITFEKYYGILFRTDVPLIIDDLHNESYMNMAKSISSKFSKNMTIVPVPNTKRKFGILWNES